MPPAKIDWPTAWNFGDLLEHLGGISPRRVRVRPAPGTATEADLLAINDRGEGLYELVEGVLVEKPMGSREAFLAAELIRVLGNFVVEAELGAISAPDGPYRLNLGVVRLPDVAFVRWEQLPDHEYPDEPIPEIVPALAVEILSESNTPAEIERKLKEYFLAGVELVWVIDPEARTTEIYTAPDESTTRTEKQALDGGRVLPGFSLPLAELFAWVKKPSKGSAKKGRGRGKSR